MAKAKASAKQLAARANFSKMIKSKDSKKKTCVCAKK